MTSKAISINPALFGMKKNQTRKVKPLLTPSTIKRELLHKIKSKTTSSDSILDSLKELETMTKTPVEAPIETPVVPEMDDIPDFPSTSAVYESMPEESVMVSSMNTQETPIDPPYGCIKNGSKPTFRRWNQTVNKKTKTIKQYSSFGKHKHSSTVRVFIQNDKRKIEGELRALDRHDMNKVRTYLKNHGLLKVGSTAPDEILRESYKNSILAGNINNKSKDVLLHNFMQDK